MINKLNKFLYFPIDAGIPKNISFEEKKKLRVLNLILIINIISPYFFIVSSLYYGISELIFIELIISVTFLIAYLLKGRLKQKLSKFILLFIVPLELFYFPLFIGNVGIEYLFFIFIYAGFYFLNNKIHFLIHIIFIAFILALSKYIIFNSIYPENYESFEKLFYYSNIVMTVLLSSLSISLLKVDTTKYQTTIEDQARELRAKVQELEKRENILTELFKELNHRVKNNLQMVSSLFTMQIYSTKNKNVKIALNGVSRRLDAIAILHQHLYKKESPFRASLRTYIHELSQSVLQMMDDDGEIELEPDIDNIFLRIEITSHIGLIINELLTYIVSYGITENGKKLKVNIKVNKDENKLNINTKVDGERHLFSDEALMNKKDSFGRKLMYAIIQRYNGSVEFFNNGKQIMVTLHID